MNNNKEKREEFFFKNWYWKNKFEDDCNPVNAIIPFLRNGDRILVIKSTNRDIFSSVLEKAGFKVDSIYFEEGSDFVNYPNEKLEVYDCVFLFPFHFRTNAAMEKLFSTKVPFVMFDILKSSLFANNKRLELINNNKCEFMFFCDVRIFPEREGEDKEFVEDTGFAFLCRDVLFEKFSAAKIYENSVELI